MSVPTQPSVLLCILSPLSVCVLKTGRKVKSSNGQKVTWLTLISVLISHNPSALCFCHLPPQTLHVCQPCTPPLHLTPHTSHLLPHTSHLTPHTSHQTTHTSYLTPHTSYLTPHTSPSPHTSHLLPHTSYLTPPCCMCLWSAVFNLVHSVLLGAVHHPHWPCPLTL